MLLPVPQLAKASFFGSLLNKCRQVVKRVRAKPIVGNNNHAAVVVVHDNVENTIKIALPTIQNRRAPTFVANFATRPSGPKSPEEQVGLPPRPKKPLTPFFRYMQSVRSKIAAEQPKSTVGEVARTISKQWEQLDVNVKRQLEQDYRREQQHYVELRAKYDATLSETQRKELKEMKQEKSDARVKRVIRKRFKDLGRPKKPLSAYLHFLQDQRLVAPAAATEKYSDWMKKCSLKWSQLAEPERQRYLITAHKALDQYKKELAAWEQQMIRAGNVDVVRQVSLIDPPTSKPKGKTI